MRADIVIPVYSERPEALAATLSACLSQTHGVTSVIVVDDGSPQPIFLPSWYKIARKLGYYASPKTWGFQQLVTPVLRDLTRP